MVSSVSIDDKTRLRTKSRQRRDDFVVTLRAGERAVAFSRLPTPLAKRVSRATVVAGYVATGSEADPARLLDHAASLGSTLALPHVTSRTAPMRFLRWDGRSALHPGPFGLMQPASDAPVATPDLVLVPLVAFDRRLKRLGQGAAHYDRALSMLPGAYAVGLAWSAQECDLVPTDPWDVPLDAILTEREYLTS